jgi:hypothetical protein
MDTVGSIILDERPEITASGEFTPQNQPPKQIDFKNEQLRARIFS